jgi:hypothetical protein
LLKVLEYQESKYSGESCESPFVDAPLLRDKGLADSVKRAQVMAQISAV